MRDKNVFGLRRALPRMSWSPKNLYNLYRRSKNDAIKRETDFGSSHTTFTTLFQQRWKSKQLVRAYHGDFINEKIFKKWYLPSTLPDLHSQLRKQVMGANSLSGPRTLSIGSNGERGKGRLMKWALRERDAVAEQRTLKELEKMSQAPITSLMLEEVEKRIDVFIFRCCFAHSVYEARRLVIHGRVKLNGKKHTNANTRIAPGDMVSVDPSAIRFLQPLESKQLETSEDTSEGTEKSVQENSEKSLEADDSEPQEKDIAERILDDVLSTSTESTESLPPPISLSNPSPSSSSGSTPTTHFNLPPYASPFLFIPAYIEVSFLTCSAIFVRRPTARAGYSEIPTPYDADGDVMRLTWEWYTRMKPRVRSASRRRMGPERREERRRIPGVGYAESASPSKEGTSLREQIAKNSVY